MRLAAKILAGVAIVLLALVGIVAAIIATIDTRTLLAPIETQLQRATGRAVGLGTRASVSISLTPTITLHDVTLANASWGSAKEMIRARRVEAEVALLPLLQRRVEVLRFTLFEPSILLETDKQGRGNWIFGETPRSPVRPSDPLSDAAGAFGVGELAIEKGEVRWRDGPSGEQTTIRVDRLYLRSRDPGKPVVAEFAGAVGEVPIALEGHFGPLDALRAQQWPWPASVKGQVAGRNTEVTTKLKAAPDTIEASELALEFGNVKLRGTLTHVSRGPRPLIRFKVEADALAPEDFAFLGGAATTGKASPSDVAAAPLRLAGLRAIDAQGDLAIGMLTLAQGRKLTAVRARIELADGRLEIPELRGNFAGGSALARLIVDARNPEKPVVAVRLNARDLELASIPGLTGLLQEVRGGKTELDIDFTARGASRRDWATSLSGLAVARVGRATWLNRSTGIAHPLRALYEAFTPFRGTDPNTVLDCAAARLSFSNGVARVDRGIAFETGRVAGSASGTIDLGRDALDLTINPRAQRVGSVDVATLVGAVRVRGPIAHPRVDVDPAGSVVAVAEVAQLAFGTGKRVLSRVASPTAPVVSGGGECATALAGTRNAPAAASPSAASPSAAPSKRTPADPVKDPVRAFGKFLGR